MCGSMRFSDEMRTIAFELETKHGFNILQCTYDINGDKLSEEEINSITKMHYVKIDLSDGIYVADIGGYIGDSVKKEILYALQKNKEIYYHSEFIK